MHKRGIIIATVVVAILLSITIYINTDDSEAAVAYTENGITYSLTDKGSDDTNTAVISRITTNAIPADLTIPKYITYHDAKYHLVSIDVSFSKNKTIKTLTIEDNPGLILKKNSLFQGTNIETAVIGDGFELPRTMFGGCKKLTSVTLPESLKTLPQAIFTGCTNLSTINIGNQITTIGNNAFVNCSKLTDFKIPDSVTSIGSNAFKNCTGLTEIYIGPNVETIGKDAFLGIDQSLIKIYATSINVGAECFLDDLDIIVIPEDNTGLTVDNGILYNKDKSVLLYFPRNITTTDGTFTTSASIGPYAFYNTLISKITIMDGATSIGEYAFSNCRNISEVNIADSVSLIGDHAFYTSSNKSSLTSIKLPAGITSVSKWMFGNCDKLTEITIPEKVETIEESSFNSCTSLQTVTVLGSLTSIETGAFSECKELVHIDLPDSIKSIGNSAFFGNYYTCEKLIITELPSGLETVDASAFRGCTNLKLAKLPENLTFIGSHAFYRTGIVSITVGETEQITIGAEDSAALYAFGGPALRSICLNNVTVADMKLCGTIVENLESLESYTIGPDFKLWSWENGIGMDKTTKTAYLVNNSISDFIIPLSVEKLYGIGFRYSNVHSIDYEGDSTRKITFETGILPNAEGNSNAGFFGNCFDLTTVKLPTVSFINEQNTFYRCTSLSSVEIASIGTLPSFSSTSSLIDKLVLHNCTTITQLPVTYYVQFPENLTKLSVNNEFYGVDGSKLDTSSPSTSLAGKTFVWNGEYIRTIIPKLVELSSGQKVVSLNYGNSEKYILANTGSVLDLEKCTIASYKVNNWYTDPEKTKLYGPSTIVSNSFTIYADAEPNTYTITKTGSEQFIVWSSEGKDLGDDIVVPGGTEITIRSKYYDTSEQNAYNMYVNGKLQIATTYITIDNDREFYVTYELKQFILSFDTQGANPINPIKGKYGDPLVKPEDPVKEGYTFAGWMPEIGDTVPADNMTYTALWAPIKVAITLDPNGGDQIGPVGRYYKTTVGELPEATREGYSFLGWYSAIEDGEKIAYETTISSVEPFTAYAKWAVNKYTISFDTNGGTTVNPITQDFGTEITIPEDPSKIGFVFLRWSPAIPSTTPAEDLMITALWAPSITSDTEGNASVDLVDIDTFVVPSTGTNTILVTLTDNTSVKVEDASDLAGKTVITTINQIANTTGINGSTYEFVFTADGSQYTGKMLVTLPYVEVSGKEAAVFYWDGTESTEMKIVDRTDGSVTFETDHNSTYIVSSKDKSEDNDVYFAAIAIVIAAIVAILITVAYTKRKA